MDMNKSVCKAKSAGGFVAIKHNGRFCRDEYTDGSWMVGNRYDPFDRGRFLRRRGDFSDPVPRP